MVRIIKFYYKLPDFTLITFIVMKPDDLDRPDSGPQPDPQSLESSVITDGSMSQPMDISTPSDDPENSLVESQLNGSDMEDSDLISGVHMTLAYLYINTRVI